jgi:DNA-binding Lrp family transcriptional regulator
MNTINSLIERGTIRALGPVFDPRKLGYVSTLAAARFDIEKADEIAATMSSINEITHSYIREHNFNLWFTVTALNDERLNAVITRIQQCSYVDKVISLPVKKTFKILAVWETSEGVVKSVPLNNNVRLLTDTEKAIVWALQLSFPIVKTPFRAIARSVGLEEDTLLQILIEWLNNGIIRRFGARLNHTGIGYICNILAAWHGSDSDSWGERFAKLPFVSHCYIRETNEDWPYELFTMIHARSEAEIETFLKIMSDIAKGAGMIAMKTLRELKKTSMKYYMED